MTDPMDDKKELVPQETRVEIVHPAKRLVLPPMLEERAAWIMEEIHNLAVKSNVIADLQIKVLKSLFPVIGKMGTLLDEMIAEVRRQRKG